MKLAIRALLLALFAGFLIWTIGPSVVPSPSSVPAATAVPAGADPTPAAGEALFWGKGRCFTCHSVGDRGGERRCPNLGAQGGLSAIGARAASRAADVTAKQGRALSATAYLVESLLDPSAYVVDGFKPEMPAVMKAPLKLSADEVRAIVVYLQSLGGSVDLGAMEVPSPASGGDAAQVSADDWNPYLAGDVARGERLFFDPAGPGCSACHKVGERGGTIGPELTHVGGVSSGALLVESILEPSARIASGYEVTEIRTQDGATLLGRVISEDDASLTVASGGDARQTVAKAAIVARTPRAESLMPAGFASRLTVADLSDLLAYLSAQR